MQAIFSQGLGQKNLEDRLKPTFKMTKTKNCVSDLHILKGDAAACCPKLSLTTKEPGVAKYPSASDAMGSNYIKRSNF